jgi:hypothetical protein
MEIYTDPAPDRQALDTDPDPLLCLFPYYTVQMELGRLLGRWGSMIN